MRILIIEDNRHLADLTAEGLTRRKFVCDCAYSAAEADLALGSAQYDALVLDLGLPDADGMSWIKGKRDKGLAAPVLMLTARSALQQRVEGLDGGADDYVVKPVETDELAARIRALLRRPGARAAPVLEVGNLSYDTSAHRARYQGRPVELSPQETSLLELLMREAGAVVRRSRIENALYNFRDEISPNAVDAAVSRLRRRLEESGARNMLHTIKGLGYLLEDREAC